MNYLFPIAFMMNTFTMTALMVILGLSGQSHLAAEVGIIQGAMTALFFSFSANARSIILNPSSHLSVDSIFRTRLVLILPLAAASYFLSALPSGAEALLIIALILRRCVEWISEIHLSEMEFLEKRAFARNFLYLQSVVFLIAVFWLLSGFPMPSLGLFIWALTPILMSVGFIRERLNKPASFQYSWRLMLPQFGSTMIIGITVYVFRLIILLITGKEIAGVLFTAFALGGMIGSIFAQVLGPSVVLYEDRNKKSFFSVQIKLFLGLTVLAGFVLFIFSQMNAFLPSIMPKSNFLFGSVGASMIGGVIMVYAQHIRFRLLQRHGDNNLFGPDLLMNLLIVASVPYLYYIVGKDALMILYMVNAILAYLFYRSSEKQDASKTQNVSAFFSKMLVTFIAVFILLPVFFQINSGIFNSPHIVYDSGGVLSSLPIPVSVIACFIGILLLGDYRRANVSLIFIFFSFIMMLIASLVSTGNHDDEINTKLIFLIQFILPMTALVLGQLYESRGENPIIYKTFLYIVIAIVPLQLLSTWMHGTFYLSPRMYLFSIYQHLQYVPVIFVSAYLIALYGLWRLPRFRKLLLVLIPIMGVYAAASNSIVALALLFSGTFGLSIYHYYKHGISKPLAFAVIVMFLLSTGYLYLGRNVNTISQKYGFLKLSQVDNFDIDNIPNVSARMYYWKYHIQKSMSGAKEFIFGDSHRPDRQKIPSAHNYYIDLLYNFGFVSLFPVLVLIGFTVVMLYRLRGQIISSPAFLCLAYVVTFLLIIDNSLKVGLRQPYPGIFTFFLWGILITKLTKLGSKYTALEIPLNA
jgi:hypothetical protein